jgi:hypothetical protein
VKEPRRLVSTRRSVPAARRAAYDALWTRVQAAASARDAHAWRFASAEREDLFLEFLEFAAGSDPRASPALSAPLARLEAEFAGGSEEWTELKDQF